MKNQKANPNEICNADFSIPLNNAHTAIIDLYAGSGNLTIERAILEESVLINGRVQYSEKQGPPTQALSYADDRVIFKLHAFDSGRPWFKLPWAPCNGATNWFFRLNRSIPMEVKTQSGGGNINLDLADCSLINLTATTGGGNIDLVLPDLVANMSASLNSGAGNVTILIPGNLEAKVHASSGLGKVIVDQRFEKIDENNYQTPDYEKVAYQVEINATTGMGNVVITFDQVIPPA